MTINLRDAGRISPRRTPNVFQADAFLTATKIEIDFARITYETFHARQKSDSFLLDRKQLPSSSSSSSPSPRLFYYEERKNYSRDVLDKEKLISDT